MFKKLFLMLATFGKQPNAKLDVQKILQVDTFEKLPKDIRQLDEGYKQLIRELAKR